MACLPLLAEAAPARREISGIHPHLATFNHEGECGTGAVVPWADRLWVISYAPHSPRGSSDKLYEITPDLQQIVRPESIGGTPANRMIHSESQQLFIGPYVIDAKRNVRVIPPDAMFGRLTGNARHLSDPANKIYCATMEEGLYEIDVHTLAVKELWADEQAKNGRHAGLPGYHGKGLYSGQGQIIYANNGDHAKEALVNPAVPSGVLASWDGAADQWKIVRRNQFTDVTGPGGISGNANPATDPVWSIGWDERSLLLMCLDGGAWHTYRLPKASHSYDGAHGWNTEWPRIRDIGEADLLMTMHGMFWKFPKTFSSSNTSGIAPRSTYLKVIGDFCRWNDQLVFGCDDTAKSEFLNKRRAKGIVPAPQSQSNLWFVAPEKLDALGPVIGRGAVWLRDEVAANTPSDPFLFSGFEHRALHLAHAGDAPVTIRIEVDPRGDGRWQTLCDVKLAACGYEWLELAGQGEWVRLRSDQPLKRATAWFNYSNSDKRGVHADPIFDGLATAADTRFTGGVVRALGGNRRTLGFESNLGCYELDGDLKLRRVEASDAFADATTRTIIPKGVLAHDEASVIYTDDRNQRWRLPRGDAELDRDGELGPNRVAREVATERDLFNAGGIFYELPAENAGGFAKARAVATHNRRIHDYCSYRGLLVMSGVTHEARDDNPHLIRSDDGKVALWVGAIDDVWKFGKPRGIGGPWKNSAVRSDEVSDPYLLTGFDRKRLTLAHTSEQAVHFTVEIDITGSGEWQCYRTFAVPSGETFSHDFPAAFQAYWMRVKSDSATNATVQLIYD